MHYFGSGTCSTIIVTQRCSPAVAQGECVGLERRIEEPGSGLMSHQFDDRSRAGRGGGRQADTARPAPGRSTRVEQAYGTILRKAEGPVQADPIEAVASASTSSGMSLPEPI